MSVLSRAYSKLVSNVYYSMRPREIIGENINLNETVIFN